MEMWDQAGQDGDEEDRRRQSVEDDDESMESEEPDAKPVKARNAKKANGVNHGHQKNKAGKTATKQADANAARDSDSPLSEPPDSEDSE